MGTAGSIAIRTLDLFAGAGSIAATLNILPLVAGLLGAANEITPRTGREPDRFLVTRLVCGSGLVLVALARDQLGLRYGEALGSAVIIGGFFVLLFWQASVSIGWLARRSSRGPRDYGAFFLVIVAVYLGVQPWQNQLRPPDGDEPYYLLMAHSLAYDLDTDLTNNYEQGDSLKFMTRRIKPQLGDPVGAHGEKYSRHNMTLAILLAPAYRLLGGFGALTLMALMTAALALSILRLADLYFPEEPTPALWAATIAALSSPLLLYSYQVWVEVPAALLTAVAAHGLLTLESKPASWRRIGVVALPILLLPLVKLRFLALSVSILGLAMVRLPRDLRTRLLRGGTILLALTALTMVFNQAVFGHALKHHSWQSLAGYLTSPAHYFKAPFGIFFDSAFGLFFSSPIWLLLIPGLWLAWGRRRRLLVDAVILCAPYLLLLGPRPYWYGGWSPAFRYGIAFLPVLSLVLIPILSKRRQSGIRLLIGLLLATTVVLTLVWLVLPGWTYNFADGRGHLLDHLTTTFGTDVARLFPSQVRPRTANLIWLVLLMFGIPAVTFGLRLKARKFSPATGATAMLALLALLPPLANRLPARIVELEDPLVVHRGGAPWPPRWSPVRPRFRGSWQLRTGDGIEIPIKPRGRELLLTLEIKRVGAIRQRARIEILADDTRLTAFDLPPSLQWSKTALDPLTWPAAAERLRIQLTGHGQGRLLLDRAQLDWR